LDRKLYRERQLVRLECRSKDLLRNIFTRGILDEGLTNKIEVVWKVLMKYKILTCIR
jgi:hypothetical protein